LRIYFAPALVITALPVFFTFNKKDKLQNVIQLYIYTNFHQPLALLIIVIYNLLQSFFAFIVINSILTNFINYAYFIRYIKYFNLCNYTFNLLCDIIYKCI